MMRRFVRDAPLERLAPVAAREEICQAQALFRQCEVSEPVMEYIAALCQAARDPERVRLGASPRGMLALLRAAQAYAALRGRAFVTPDDVKRLAVPVLAHRLIPRGLYGREGESDRLMEEILQAVPVPTEARQ